MVIEKLNFENYSLYKKITEFRKKRANYFLPKSMYFVNNHIFWISEIITDKKQNSNNHHIPPAMSRKSLPLARYTSMYRRPMWCLWRLSAKFRCSSLSKRTKASPLRRPSELKQRATPPLLFETKFFFFKFQSIVYSFVYTN